MSTDANKAVVLRFIDEVQNGKNLDVMNEFFAPDVTDALRGVPGPAGRTPEDS